MNEPIQQIADAIKAASPVIWESALKQVRIDGIECLIAGVVFLTMASITIYKGVRSRGIDEDDYYILWWTAASVGTIISSVAIVYAINCFFNPTYTAIKYILGR